MDTLKCKAFVTAVKAGSLLAAADIMKYTPSGINRMITALEDELQVKLIHRNRKGVYLTDEGQSLFPLILDYINTEDKILQYCSEFNGLIRGNIRIGSFYCIAAHRLPHIMESFLVKYPNIHIQITEDGTPHLLKSLKTHAIDCCIIDNPEDSSYCFQELMHDEILVWLPGNHPLTAYNAIPISELSNYPFIAMAENKRSATEHALPNLSLDIRYTTEDSYTAYRMVEAGLGISMNNAIATEQWNGNVVTRPLDPHTTVSIGLVTLRDTFVAPATQKFMDFLSQNWR